MASLLKYPEELPPDYMLISAHEFASRPSGRRVSTFDSMTNLSVAPAIGTIRLPIPELAPMDSPQKYGEMSGAFNNALATAIGEAYNGSLGPDGDISNIDVGGIASRLRAQVSSSADATGRELAAGFASKALTNVSGSMLQAMSTGEITNPNIELLYDGPSLRSFSYTWTMSPKNPGEVRSIYEIIKFVKQNYLPEANGGMLRVPSVWMVKIMQQGGESKWYQKHYTAAMTNFIVKQNSNGPHMTMPDGSPVMTQMTMNFKEVNIRTANDYRNNI